MNRGFCFVVVCAGLLVGCQKKEPPSAIVQKLETVSAALRRVSRDVGRINLSDGGHHHTAPPGFGGGHGEGDG